MNTAIAVLAKKSASLAFVVLLLLGAQPALAQDEEAIGPAGPFYVPLQPAFVLNYGGQGRLKYLRAEISVRVDSIHVANSVRHHLPYIRNNLVMLFSRQTEEEINSLDGRETMRKKALEEVRRILLKEDKTKKGVEDLFFTNFVVQK
ncbi:flagellar basal body-associated FliL family protein [Pseudoteredinibacter isoporae]|uniref:Flagellar protein FliL n=1 Tax=Pseudoteredinibacter isoporae TaxID=570281 RepID=A0A7X0JQL5_9GAMM|nr:flagellar basal body-associated FliL family protein [Pseudoteredinibacter isoporae]MBB6520479.1 flagellar FliL protein [Pseudoteredinibacter isoporae]NHO86046.1 flagellar basal body rod protein [Pseudoteredinibacter isoporae]NIB25503.1 flagellar basal body rod protein [Pseudoteredinibacter isoporae]